MRRLDVLQTGKHSSPQLAFNLIKRPEVAIPCRDRGHRQRPAEPEPRVVVGKTPFGARRVDLAQLVAGDGIGAQRLVAMRETLGNIQRAQ